jgi:hypothetical protein
VRKPWPLYCLAAYAACLILLLPRLPLSLDEILDLMSLRSHGWRELITNIARNAGGTPLSYLVRLPLIRWFGESSAAARLPSALFSIAACSGVFLLARRLGLRWPLLAALVFATFPLQFRYALEARAYSQALCLSVWATIFFLRWMDRKRSFWLALLYGLTIVGGIYTQPYTIFVPAAHCLWLGIRRDRWMFLWTGTAIIIAGAAFVPWYRFSVPLWKEGVAAVYPQSTIGLRAVELILREIAGTGYFGTALLICALAVAFRFGFPMHAENRHAENRSFLALYLAIPLIGAVAADTLFVYFLAVRQMIFVLAPLAVLFALGIETSLARGWRVAATLLTIALLGASTYEDIHAFYRPHDNFGSAAAILAADPTCVIYVPEDSRLYYSFFRPELASRDCDLKAAERVAVAVSPWGRDKADLIERRLRDSGFAKLTQQDSSGSVIERYSR